MKWLRRKIRNWLNEPDECIGATSNMPKLQPASESAYTVTIHKAVNGDVLEYQQLDDHYQHIGASIKNRELRIIPPDGDLVGELAALLVAARTK